MIPALAIARELRDAHGAEVRFVGTARGLETRLVPEAGFPLDLVRSGQLKNVSLATRLRTAIDLPLGVVECVRLLREFRPQAVVGVGGYASGPGMLAAILLRLPTLAFEPNAVPGLANRLVGRWVSAAAVNFAQTQRYFRNARVTGIPVRAEFFAIAPKSAAAPPRLLVFGGSQGARVLNEAMPKIAPRLLDQFPSLEIVHQAGARHAESTAEAYARAGLSGQQSRPRAAVSGPDAARVCRRRSAPLPQRRQHHGGAWRGGQGLASGSLCPGRRRPPAPQRGGLPPGRRGPHVDRGRATGRSRAPVE